MIPAMNIALVKMPYTGARNVPEQSASPGYLDNDELHGKLHDAGAPCAATMTVQLDPQQEAEYGRWHRMGLACGNLAGIVTEQVRRQRFVVGLLGNCTALLGMLSGLQQSGSVGMLFLDAHGDFNTPETTLSGMLGGMPVAVAAGHCLERLRLEAGLDPPLEPRSIVLGGVRDLDPQEQTLIEQQGVEVLSVDQIRPGSSKLGEALARLASAADAIYVHVDMDVLDPAEVSGHHTAVDGGLTSDELAVTLGQIVAEPKVAALGIASTPGPGSDEGGLAHRAAHRLVAAAARALVERRPASKTHSV
jgi:arginase